MKESLKDAGCKFVTSLMLDIPLKQDSQKLEILKKRYKIFEDKNHG